MIVKLKLEPPVLREVQITDLSPVQLLNGVHRSLLEEFLFPNPGLGESILPPDIMRGDVRGELDDVLCTDQAVFHLRLVYHTISVWDIFFKTLHWYVLVCHFPSEVDFLWLPYHLYGVLLGDVKLLGALLGGCGLGCLCLACGI